LPLAAAAAYEPAIRAAVELAVRTHQILALPTDMSGPRDSATTRIAQIVTGEAADAEQKSLQNALAMEQTATISFLDAGIDHLNIASPDVDNIGVAASAKGTVETWLGTARKQRDGSWQVSEPHNTLDFMMTLVVQGSRWMVDSFDWTFAPGSEP
jgi:hypothetical protein